jgi:hypothetical protein
VDEHSPANSRPAWFASFLADRGTREPSPHTLKAYGQDFDGVAAIIVGDADAVSPMPLSGLRQFCITSARLKVGFGRGRTSSYRLPPCRLVATVATCFRRLDDRPCSRQSTAARPSPGIVSNTALWRSGLWCRTIRVPRRVRRPSSRSLRVVGLGRLWTATGVAEELPGFIPRVLRLDDVSLLRADETVFNAMVDGCRAQMLARGLAVDTIKV